MGICRLRRLESATALRDLQILTERCVSRVSNQAKSERLSKLPTFVVVGIVLSRVVDELVVDTCELLEAVEIESDSCSSSTGSLARDEHVHLGVRSVAHVVDKGDLPPQIIEITRPAIKKDTQRFGSGRDGGRLVLGEYDWRCHGQQEQHDCESGGRRRDHRVCTEACHYG